MAQIDELLILLRDLDGSDLHLRAGLEPRVRVHGRLRSLADWSPMGHGVLLDVFKEMTPPERWEHFENKRDVDFAYALEGHGRFRANLFYQEQGAAGVFRAVPHEIKPLRQLGLPTRIEGFAHQAGGLLLMTGTTGSGKSTTMASLLDVINQRYTRHIVTIEDPIEFLHSNKKSIFTHREVGLQTRSFAAALRVAMRQDPDVLLVGEMRDAETISLALEAAEMGALVFSSLHARNAASALERVVGSFPAESHSLIRSVLAESLIGVIAQVLVPTADGHGRVPAVEILRRTRALPSVIRDGQVQKIYSVVTGDDLLTLDDSLLDLVRKGTISPDVAREKATDREKVERSLNIFAAQSTQAGRKARSDGP